VKQITASYEKHLLFTYNFFFISYTASIYFAKIGGKIGSGRIKSDRSSNNLSIDKRSKDSCYFGLTYHFEGQNQHCEEFNPLSIKVQIPQSSIFILYYKAIPVLVPVSCELW